MSQIAYYVERVSSSETDRREMGRVSTHIVSNYTLQTWGKALADYLEVTIHNTNRY